MKTKQKPIYIDDLHFEHTFWRRQLNFQKDELGIFTERLGEIVNRWTDKEVLAKAEHFQNAFIRHGEVIDTILHEINLEEDRLAEMAKGNPTAIDHVRFEDHADEREKVFQQVKLYDEMKLEFMKFLRHTM